MDSMLCAQTPTDPGGWKYPVTSDDVAFVPLSVDGWNETDTLLNYCCLTNLFVQCFAYFGIWLILLRIILYTK